MKNLMSYLKEDKKMSDSTANIGYGHIAGHPEVLKEFESYLNTRSFKTPDGSSLVFSGYSAEKITKEIKLSPLEAYTFLVFLKEFPETAKEDLAKRLQKK